ncbi:MAG: SHOCT domain-containing protein [Anaerolineae bacterium]|nr:SHOCT domain-containing protein [Anaerolineae bacterium]
MMMGGGLLIGLVVLVLVVLLIGGGIAAVVWFVGQSSRSPREGSGQEPRRESEALEILRQRYARGEIDREEFERMREEIRS